MSKFSKSQNLKFLYPKVVITILKFEYTNRQDYIDLVMD